MSPSERVQQNGRAVGSVMTSKPPLWNISETPPFELLECSAVSLSITSPVSETVVYGCETTNIICNVNVFNYVIQEASWTQPCRKNNCHHLNGIITGFSNKVLK